MEGLKLSRDTVCSLCHKETEEGLSNENFGLPFHSSCYKGATAEQLQRMLLDIDVMIDEVSKDLSADDIKRITLQAQDLSVPNDMVDLFLRIPIELRHSVQVVTVDGESKLHLGNLNESDRERVIEILETSLEEVYL